MGLLTNEMILISHNRTKHDWYLLIGRLYGISFVFFFQIFMAKDGKMIPAEGDTQGFHQAHVLGFRSGAAQWQVNV